MTGLAHLGVTSLVSYLIAVLLPALDVLVPVLPSEAAVIALGVSTAGSTDPRIAVLVALAAFGAFAGDNVAYLLGRRLGPAISGRMFAGPRGERRLAWARRSLGRYGAGMIIVCRFIPGGRTAVTVTCGLIGYPWRRFAVADGCAAVLWALYAFFIGRLGGQAFQDRPWIGLLVAFGLTVVVSAAIEGIRRLRSRRPAHPTSKENGMQAPQVRRAVEAGRATACALGLEVDDVVVIHNSDRIALRLVPCDVLARVAPLAHQADSEFEVVVACRLAGTDGPVAGLDPRAENRVYLRDGFAISLWTYYEPAGPQIAPAEYAGALMRLHAALRQTDLGAPHLTDRVAGAQAEVGDQNRTPALPGPDRELLSHTLSSLGSSISRGGAGEQLLHGEPHPGNLLSTNAGPLFVDLGTCCRGPVEFDVAHAPDEVAGHYPGADQRLIQQCRILVWALFSTWRWRHDDQLPDRQYWRMERLNRVRAALRNHPAEADE